MEFIKPSKEEWKALAKIFDLRKKLTCHFCGDKVVLGKNSAILCPFKGMKKDYIISCDSPLCISEYLRKIEDEEEEKMR